MPWHRAETWGAGGVAVVDTWVGERQATGQRGDVSLAEGVARVGALRKSVVAAQGSAGSWGQEQ